MFINFWHPAEESGNLLADKPLKVQMLGLNFVLWRDSQGRAHCAHNTCTHRGGSLGDGKVVGDCIQCPYHGWKFNGTGACERIPSLGLMEEIPRRSRIDAYPVEERYGLIFVFLGDLPEAERPTIMPSNEYGQTGWATLTMRYRWKCNYIRLVENQSDPSHVEYVHARSPPAKAKRRQAAVRTGDRAHYFWLYPNFMVNIYEDVTDTNLVIPRGIDRTEVIFDYYFADVSESAREKNLASIAVSEKIQAEDVAICESVQPGLNSRAYDTGRLSVRGEAGEHLFHRLLHADLQRGPTEAP